MKGSIVSVASGDLVRMRTPDGGIEEVSIPEVGHRLAEGAVIVDGNDENIPPTEMRVRKIVNGTSFTARVVDPGNQYPVCFLLETPGHLARLYKA